MAQLWSVSWASKGTCCLPDLILRHTQGDWILVKMLDLSELPAALHLGFPPILGAVVIRGETAAPSFIIPPYRARSIARITLHDSERVPTGQAAARPD